MIPIFPAAGYAGDAPPFPAVADNADEIEVTTGAAPPAQPFDEGEDAVKVCLCVYITCFIWIFTHLFWLQPWVCRMRQLSLVLPATSLQQITPSKSRLPTLIFEYHYHFRSW